MTQQSHYWVFTQKNQNQDPGEIGAIACPRSAVHGNQGVETARMCVSRCTDKGSVVCSRPGILFSLEKEGSSAVCDNVDEPFGHYAK